MTQVTRNSLCTAAAVLKKGSKAGFVNAKDACNHLPSGSVFPTISALPWPRCVSSAFPHGIFALFTTNRAALHFNSIKEASLVWPLSGISVVGSR